MNDVNIIFYRRTFMGQSIDLKAIALINIVYKTCTLWLNIIYTMCTLWLKLHAESGRSSAVTLIHGNKADRVWSMEMSAIKSVSNSVF